MEKKNGQHVTPTRQHGISTFDFPKRTKHERIAIDREIDFDFDFDRGDESPGARERVI